MIKPVRKFLPKSNTGNIVPSTKAIWDKARLSHTGPSRVDPRALSQKRFLRRYKNQQFEAGEQQLIHFDHCGSVQPGSVDPSNGVIRGVSIITSGIKARGHDLEVDRTTVAQMFACCEAKGKIPVKWNHKTGSDAINGYLTNFYVEGGNLRGDWYLLQSHAQYNQAIELAERMPESFGLSASFQGEAEEVGGSKKARCSDLISVDVVATPAANPNGLFEAKFEVDTDFSDMQYRNGSPEVGELLDRISALEDQVEEQDALLAEIQGSEDDGEYDDDEFEYDDEFEDEYDDDIEGEYDDGYGDDAGEYAGVGAADTGGEGSAFSALARKVHYLEAREAARVQAARDARQQHGFEVIRNKVANVVELCRQYAAENEALREQLFTSGTAPLNFSMGRDLPATNFDALVDEIMFSENISKGNATRKAIAAHPDVYFEHRRARQQAITLN